MAFDLSTGIKIASSISMQMERYDVTDDLALGIQTRGASNVLEHYNFNAAMTCHGLVNWVANATYCIIFIKLLRCLNA